MPQLDSLVIFSQSQLIIIFFLGYYFFLYKVMPILFVSLAVCHELIVYKYYKYVLNIESLDKCLSTPSKNIAFSLILISYLEKYKRIKAKIYLG